MGIKHQITVEDCWHPECISWLHLYRKCIVSEYLSAISQSSWVCCLNSDFAVGNPKSCKPCLGQAGNDGYARWYCSGWRDGKLRGRPKSKTTCIQVSCLQPLARQFGQCARWPWSLQVHWQVTDTQVSYLCFQRHLILFVPSSSFRTPH